MNNHQNNIQECPKCGNYVEGKEQRGFVRQAVHDGPEIVVDWIPVGGKLLWKGTKQIVQFLLKTDIQKWGGELERLLYKDIQVEYTCPKCGKCWKETHPMSESEYKQWVNDVIERAKNLMPKKEENQKETPAKEKTLQTINTRRTMNESNIKLQIPYPVVVDFVKEQYQQQIRLEYVNENTINVSKPLKLKILTHVITQNICVQITIEGLTGSDVTLSYNAGLGLDLIIKGVLAWFKDKLSGVVEKQDGNLLVVHLYEKPQLRNVLEKINLAGIAFEQEHINIQFNLKKVDGQ